MNELPTINIKGKKYVPIVERVRYFNETYQGGRIVTELLSHIDSPLVLFKATVWPDVSKGERYFTGHSSYPLEGDMPAFEVAETSAVGRALALMGIGIVDSIASADEMNKATFKKAPLKEGELKTGKKDGRQWYAKVVNGKYQWLKQEEYNEELQKLPPPDMEAPPF